MGTRPATRSNLPARKSKNKDATTAVQKRANQMAAYADAFQIVDVASLNAAQQMLVQMRGTASEWEEIWEKPCRLSLASHRANIAQRDGVGKTLGTAGKNLKNRAGEFVLKARHERERIEKIRLQAVLDAQQADADAKAQHLREVARAKEQRAAEVQEALAGGDTDTAAELERTPPNVAPPPPPPPPVVEHAAVELAATVPGGLSVGSDVKYEIVDETLVPERFLRTIVDEDKIKDVVATLGMKAEIPGVRVYEKARVRVTG